MGLIHLSDFVDLWFKLQERGTAYAAKKFISTPSQRIQSTWQTDDLPGSNWWQVEAVRKRWNKKITGHEDMIYPDYVVNKWFNGASRLKMLSIGCGTGQREMEFAKHACFENISAFDIAPKTIAEAQQTALQKGLTNCQFYVGDVYQDLWPNEGYDVVLFHSSLHHFKHIDAILEKVKSTLKPNGLLIINEYVGASRFQFTAERKRQVNDVYKTLVPLSYKTRKNSKAIKHNVYFPGLLRMILSDPSEAIESAKILPLLNQHFTLLEQKNYGGNLLTFLLKDIAHHFNHADAQSLLQRLFEIEDQWLEQSQQSDFVFAVYKK